MISPPLNALKRRINAVFLRFRGGIIPHNGLSRQFVKKDNTLFVNILSEYRFVVYIILGVRDAFCGARGWQCVCGWQCA